MIFNTFWFVIFASAVIPIFWLLRKPFLRMPFLAAACVVFHYHFAGPAGMAPIVVLGIITYLLGLTRNKMACAFGIALSVIALCFYKYTHFLATDVLTLINKDWGPALEASGRKLLPQLAGKPGDLYLFIPPLGMSFFAFEFVHYLYEVRKGAAPIRNPLHFVLFSVFFPSLVAGPIKRFGQFIPSLEHGARSVDTSDVSEGLRRVAIGYVKKIIIADNLTLAIDHYVPQFETLSLLTRWAVFIVIGLRILMDFSGYSDIAIGLARLMGIKLPENFNWPYAAKSIQDFWQRWHISLSSWIRDYVYIPLGGNRHGIVRKVFNGVFAFALCGLWHGPAWNFVVWGLYHGVGLAICANYRSIPSLGPKLGAYFDRAPRLSWLLTQLFVFLGWLYFFYPVARANSLAKQLLDTSAYRSTDTMTLVIIGGLLAVLWAFGTLPQMVNVTQQLSAGFRHLRQNLVARTLVIGAFVGLIAMAGLGRLAARHDVHPQLLRWTMWTSPETKYYPTVNEMMATVRSKIKPGQILVVVGGNSVLRGVGQPPEHLWSNYLQKELGDGYCVVNFAFNGSTITDGAAVLAEALRSEFPKQIYMANAAPTQSPLAEGSGVYRFMFWDAHEKGLLVNDPLRESEIARFHAMGPYTGNIAELKLQEKLDRWFYFQDFWNDVTFVKFNTVWGFYMPGLVKFLQPRVAYKDPEPDRLLASVVDRFPDASLEAEMINVRGCSEYAFTKGPDGNWQVYQPKWDEFDSINRATFPPDLKKRSLILMSRNSPYYVRKLTAEEQVRDDLAYNYAVKKWKEYGCDSIDYGKDFTVDDYADRTHLTWHGGVKLSKVVATKVREMSKNLGYQPAQ